MYAESERDGWFATVLGRFPGELLLSAYYELSWAYGMYRCIHKIPKDIELLQVNIPSKFYLKI